MNDAEGKEPGVKSCDFNDSWSRLVKPFYIAYCEDIKFIYDSSGDQDNSEVKRGREDVNLWWTYN